MERTAELSSCTLLRIWLWHKWKNPPFILEIKKFEEVFKIYQISNPYLGKGKGWRNLKSLQIKKTLQSLTILHNSILQEHPVVHLKVHLFIVSSFHSFTSSFSHVFHCLNFRITSQDRWCTGRKRKTSGYVSCCCGKIQWHNNVEMKRYTWAHALRIRSLMVRKARI